MPENIPLSKNDQLAIKPGDHFCSIYRNRQEQFLVIIPFFKEGLKANQKCIYITEENSEENVLADLDKGGIETNTFCETKQLIILSKHESYLKGGFFNPASMISLLAEFERTVIAEGYAGLRVAGEMVCLCTRGVADQGLIEYESKLNGFFPNSKVSAICQYDEQAFSPEILKEILHAHPSIFIYGNLRGNAYFSPLSHIDKDHAFPAGSYEMIRDDLLRDS